MKKVARVTTKGIDHIARKLAQMGKNVEPACEKAVYEGGKLLAEKLQEACPVRTGTLRKSIKAEKAKVDFGKGIYSLVHPTGEQHGERNGMIAFVTEYGRSNMPPRPWWFPTIAASGQEVSALVKETFMKEIGKE